jgi:rhodanese-related sulfurtransferase
MSCSTRPAVDSDDSDPNRRSTPWSAARPLIDIRSEYQRERDGVIPGAHFVPRNALEWRLDPASGHSDSSLGDGLDRVVILVCDEGYQSSLAAATLQDLGFPRATDLVGGFKAWRAAGLCVEPHRPT